MTESDSQSVFLAVRIWYWTTCRPRGSVTGTWAADFDRLGLRSDGVARKVFERGGAREPDSATTRTEKARLTEDHGLNVHGSKESGE